MKKFLLYTSTALTLLFLGLKLGNVLQWSWLWVLSPFWLFCCSYLALAIVAVIVYLRDAEDD